MPGVYSIASFIVKLKVIELELEVVGHAAIAAACQMIADEAKRVIGTYDYGWPSLAPSTLAKKSADTPLLETGKMRASIEWNASGNTGAVGSNSDVAVFQELGTSRIPPRPFLMGAAMEMEPKIHALFKRAVVACIAGRGLHSSEMTELLHFLHMVKHVGHAVGEAMDTVLDGPDDGNKRR
jgi:phage gpG-like protein